MSHPKNYADRRYARHVKGMRRLRQDRAEHGSDHSCPCFALEADQGRGSEFSRFADTPTLCSDPGCCGNPRHGWGGLTMQERKALDPRE